MKVPTSGGLTLPKALALSASESVSGGGSTFLCPFTAYKVNITTVICWVLCIRGCTYIGFEAAKGPPQKQLLAKGSLDKINYKVYYMNSSYFDQSYMFHLDVSIALRAQLYYRFTKLLLLGNTAQAQTL